MLVSKSLTGEGGRKFAIELLREDRQARTDIEFWRECMAVANFYIFDFIAESGLVVKLEFSCVQNGTSAGGLPAGVRLNRAEFGFHLGKSKCYGPGGAGDPDVWGGRAPWGLDDKSLVTDSEIKESQDKADQP